MEALGSRRGKAGAGAMPLMVLAFLSVGGLMAWLFVQAAPVEIEVVDEENFRDLTSITELVEGKLA